MECSFVVIFTLIMVASIYASMWDHYAPEDVKDGPLNVTQYTLQIVNSFVRLIVILLYASLLWLFKQLIDAENEFLAPMKC